MVLWLALFSRGLDWRRVVVQTLLAGGLWVWALTEGLSQLALLGKPALAIGWAAFLVAAAVAIDRQALPKRLCPRDRPRSDRLLLGAAGGVIAVSAGAAFLSAVFGAPNAIDVLNYHLPRVVFWLQSGSVEFFPANYYQQLSLQPMAEYAMAHAFALTGGDRFVQLIAWAAFVGSICGVSWLASLLGAGWRAQVLAAALVAVAPNAALQASGAKNDLAQTFFLIAAAGFALQTAQTMRRGDAAWAGAAAGLALLTKGTAYVFAPGLAVGVLIAVPSADRRALFRHAGLIAVIALALNAPHYVRNYNYNGHPLGDGTATETPEHRYANERIDAGVVFSNILRNAALQFPAVPRWAQPLFQRVRAVHSALGLDPDDRATTFGTTMFKPAVPEQMEKVNEELAPNLLHTILLLPLSIWLLWRRRMDGAAGLSIGVLLAFVLFCALIKWQPWHARMHTPLHLLACAPMGMMLAGIRRPIALAPVAAAALCLLVPALLYNQMRPLLGSGDVFRTNRFEQYFVISRDSPQKYRLATDFILESDCRRVGIDATREFNQYPLLSALLAGDSSIRLLPSGIRNASAQLRPPGWFDDPCAVVCLKCGDEEYASLLYGPVGPPTQFETLAVFSKSEPNSGNLGSEADDVPWLLDLDGDFVFDPAAEERHWGARDHLRVWGDWNGDGKDQVGSVDPADAIWFRDLNGDFVLELPEEAQVWGPPGATPLVGDWNGDGKDDVGAFYEGVWYLDLNGDGAFDPATEERSWGPASSTPIVGDWNGDGRDEIAAFAEGVWFMDFNGDGVLDPVTEQKYWGSAGWVPAPGDWNGDGKADLGVFSNGVWHIDRNGDGQFDPQNEEVGWGPPGSIPVVGDWNGDGRDDLAAVDPSTMTWFVDRNGDSTFGEDTEIHRFGSPGDQPIAGDWNGDGRDQIGVIRGGK